jgi:hypothetical protein
MTSARSTASLSDLRAAHVDNFNAAVETLVGEHHMTRGDVSKLLGYSGANWRRDLTSVITGASQKITLVDASRVLRREIDRRRGEAQHHPEHVAAQCPPLSDFDAGHVQGTRAPMGSATSVCGPGADRSSNSDRPTGPRSPCLQPTASPRQPGESVPTSAQPETTSAHLPASLSDLRAAHVDNFNAAVETLVGEHHMTRGDVSKLLGYSGANWRRDLTSVITGASQKITLVDASRVLRREIEGRRGV